MWIPVVLLLCVPVSRMAFTGRGGNEIRCHPRHAPADHQVGRLDVPVQDVPAVGGVQPFRRRPGHRQQVGHRQRAVRPDVLVQGAAGDVVHHQERPRLVGRVHIPAVGQADDGRVVQVPEHLGLGEHLAGVPPQVVQGERLDHHLGVHVLVLAQERHPEPPGPQDAHRLVLAGRERGEPPGVQLDRLHQLLDGPRPVPPLQGRPVGAEVRLGLAAGVRVQVGDRPEVRPGRLEVPGHHLQPADRVQQGRHPVAVRGRQGPVPGHQLLDQLPLAVVADRQAVPRP